MMALSGLATGRTVQSVIFLLLLTFSSYALAASDFPISHFTVFKSRRYSPVFKAQDRAESRKLAAVPPAEVPVPGNFPVPSPANPLPPSTPPNRRPAVISPSSNNPEADLPPKIRTPPPPSVAPITSPAAASPSKQSNVAVILGVTLGVIVFSLVSLSAAAYFKPEWLPCCQGRSSRLTQYERHVPT